MPRFPSRKPGTYPVVPNKPAVSPSIAKATGIPHRIEHALVPSPITSANAPLGRSASQVPRLPPTLPRLEAFLRAPGQRVRVKGPFPMQGPRTPSAAMIDAHQTQRSAGGSGSRSSRPLFQPVIRVQAVQGVCRRLLARRAGLYRTPVISRSSMVFHFPQGRQDYTPCPARGGRAVI